MKATLPARSRATPKPRYSRMPDRCPRCWEPCLPVGWTVEGVSVRALYVCPRCGHSWPCWWHRECVGIDAGGGNFGR